MFHLDPHPFARGGSVAIVTVSAMHVFDALMMGFVPSSRDATCLISIIRAMHELLGWLGVYGEEVCLLISAFLATVGAFYRLGWLRLVIFLPQHLLLGISAIGGLIAAYEGTYFDGTIMSWAHILTDQLGYFAIFIIHTSAIIRRCRDPNG